MSRTSSASVPVSSSLAVSSIHPTHPARKPIHAVYLFFPRPATQLSRRLYRPDFPPLRPDSHRLGSVQPPPLHHRVHLHRRSGRCRTLVAVPPLLLPLRLVVRRPH